VTSCCALRTQRSWNISIRDRFKHGHFNCRNTFISIGVLCLLLATSCITQLYEIAEDEKTEKTTSLYRLVEPPSQNQDMLFDPAVPVSMLLLV
jgi:hypothetical protein